MHMGVESGASVRSGPNDAKAVWITLVTLAVVIVGIFVVVRLSQERAHDRLTDKLYCTLSGVGPFDRGPNTGRLCADLLTAT